jgi:hypothetical protein
MRYTLRVIEAVLALVIWPKMLYFLKMYDNISTLVEIIFNVKFFNFMLIFIWIIMLFASIFWLLGKNQIMCNSSLESNGNCMVESITLEYANPKQPLYISINGALRFVYYLALGEFEYRG